MTAEELFKSISGPYLRQQRMLIHLLIKENALPSYEIAMLEGIESLLDVISDIAHDEYGKDSLLVKGDVPARHQGIFTVAEEGQSLERGDKWKE